MIGYPPNKNRNNGNSTHKHKQTAVNVKQNETVHRSDINTMKTITKIVRKKLLSNVCF